MKLWGKKNKRALSTRIEPATLTEYRWQLLQQHAQLYTRAVDHVFQLHRIPAANPAWSLAPRYIAISLRLLNVTDLQRAKNCVNEIGLAAGMGRGSDTTTSTEVILLGRRLYYQFTLPEFITVPNHNLAPTGTVRLWSDVPISHSALQLTSEMRGFPVGLALGEYPVCLNLTDEASQVLICGAPGSGKTQLAKTMVYQMMRGMTPEELSVAIIDPMANFLKFEKEQHMAYGLVHSAEDIRILLHHVEAEFRRREAGGPKSQKFLLVIDEANNESTLLNPANHDRVLDIVRRGRHVNMTVIVVTHIPDVGSIGHVGESLTNRWYGMMPSAQKSGQVGSGLNLHKLGGRGDFYAQVGPNQARFQVAMVGPDDYSNLTYKAEVPLARMTEIDLPPELDPLTSVRNPSHRPNIVVDLAHVMYYVYHQNAVTQREAHDVLGLSRRGHELTKLEAKKALDYLRAIKRAGGRWPGKLE